MNKSEQRGWGIDSVTLNGKVVNIVITDGVITEIAKTTDIEGIDASGLIAVPALVDPHVHSRVMGETDKEDEKTLVLAAMHSGVLTIFDEPNNKEPITTIEALEIKMALFENADIDVRFWFGATPENQAEYASLVHYPKNVGIKVYMGSSTGGLLVAEDGQIRVVFIEARKHDILVEVHAEDEAMMRAKYGRILDQNGRVCVSDHCQIRDTEVEVSAVKRALILQAQTGVRLYFAHLSSPEAVELVKNAKDKGAKVYAEVCPHHLYFNSDLLNGGRGAFYKMNPPLRSPEQVERLVELVCRPDFVDCIGTDHAPHLVAEKESGEYDTTPSGVPGLETMFGSMYNFVSQSKMSLERFISLTSGRAAEIFGLDAGKIEVGMPANLLLVDPALEEVWSNEDIKSKCGWTPFDGMSYKGVIVETILNGVIRK